ncbi:3893_t:CDS:2 [Dentiscutata erythropus]|uniref:3893_t:CDS:1 n=1 Tax=Dentiscutata erythropus TaxID=1348616 RepID=A0A9N9ICI7_9GLOM|nr:3893_t:CDS:2 [Dentiscutata erythropus]
MSFHSSGSERVLPPIVTLGTNNLTPVLPPVSSLAPPVSSPLCSPPPDFSSPSFVTRTPTITTKQVGLKIYPSSECIRTSFESGHFQSHSNMLQQYEQQSYSSPRQIRSATQVVMATPTHPHSIVSRPMHHPYQHPVYHQNDRVDPATELLAEKRRRNAGASARFRDRRKQREREMQEKCQFLERRVQELESMDHAKLVLELEKKLEEAIIDKKASQEKLGEMEKEIHQLRIKLREQEPESLTPPSSAGESDSKDDFFSFYSRVSRASSTSSTSSDESRKPTDVKSLLS